MGNGNNVRVKPSFACAVAGCPHLPLCHRRRKKPPDVQETCILDGPGNKFWRTFPGSLYSSGKIFTPHCEGEATPGSRPERTDKEEPSSLKHLPYPGKNYVFFSPSGTILRDAMSSRYRECVRTTLRAYYHLSLSLIPRQMRTLLVRSGRHPRAFICAAKARRASGTHC